jgi:DNA-binding LacI/PurR family transcriptional regulator
MCPLAAHAQQLGSVRRIGVLMSTTEDDIEVRARVAGFVNGLRDLGLSEGRNLKLDVRWGSSDVKRLRALASEMVALAPKLPSRDLSYPLTKYLFMPEI